MKQKLAIIAAWLHDPKLIIMDEPFVGLDPKASHLLKGMMREVCERGGAIFFSTHVLEVAEKLCDKVAIIKNGRLIRSGTMEEVKGDDSLVSLKLKNKSFITVFISLLFFGAYYFVCFKAQTAIRTLVENAVLYGEKVIGSAYPVYLFGKAGAGDPAAVAIVSAVVLALFALMWLLLSRSFLKITTATGKTERKAYRASEAKQGSAASALLGKEFKRFTASPNYMLNCGLGIIMMPLCGALLLWKGQTIFAALDEVFGAGDNFVTVLLCSVLSVLISMNDMTAPSVSLEGKSLWLLQSLPVRPWQVLRAKLSVQLILTAVPAVICILCACIAYSFTALQLAAIILVPLLFMVLSTLLGLFLGLKMPNLTWTNEITPIKQSVSVLLALFSGTVYAALLTIGYLMFGHALNFALYMGCFAALSLILSAVLYLWLKKKGTAVFAAL